MNQPCPYEAPLPVNREAIRLSPDLHQWSQRIEALMAQGARIIAFRGAGTVNGIEPSAAGAAAAMLHEYVAAIAANDTPVVLMYDGDSDNRQKPDVGSVFGDLADSLSEHSNVSAIAAQTEGWYSPHTPNAPIESALGTPFETYIFPDNLPGAHASLTQSAALVGYAGYEQVFVGPAGPIAFAQLDDLSQKAVHRPPEVGGVRVTVVGTSNNPAIDNELSAQQEVTSDEQVRAEIAAKLAQRTGQPYGALFTSAGEFSVDTSQFPGIKFTVISIRS